MKSALSVGVASFSSSSSSTLRQLGTFVSLGLTFLVAGAFATGFSVFFAGLAILGAGSFLNGFEAGFLAGAAFFFFVRSPLFWPFPVLLFALFQSVSLAV